MLTFIYLFTVAWAFAASGVIVGIFAKSWDSIMVLTNFFLMPLTFLGGVFYSIDMLPTFWKTVSMFNPIVYMVNGFRYGILGVSDVSLTFTYTMIGIFIILFYSWAFYLMRTGYGMRS